MLFLFPPQELSPGSSTSQPSSTTSLTAPTTTITIKLPSQTAAAAASPTPAATAEPGSDDPNADSSIAKKPLISANQEKANRIVAEAIAKAAAEGKPIPKVVEDVSNTPAGEKPKKKRDRKKTPAKPKKEKEEKPKVEKKPKLQLKPKSSKKKK